MERIEPLNVTHVVFLKPWSTLNGSTVFYFPVNTVVPLGYDGKLVLAKKEAVTLINRGICKPQIEGTHETHSQSA